MRMPLEDLDAMKPATGNTHRLVAQWRRAWIALPVEGAWRKPASWLAALGTQAGHARAFLASIDRRGFIDPRASVAHRLLHLGKHVYLGAGVTVQEAHRAGGIILGDRVQCYGHSFLETGHEGTIRIGADTHVQPGCHMHSHLSAIHIGERVEIGPACAFYNYDHGTAPGIPVMDQALRSRGPISVGDGAWLGHGVTVLQGVSIGAGAVIAAGAVVSRDIPENAIAAGVPARVVRLRSEPARARRPRSRTIDSTLSQPS